MSCVKPVREHIHTHGQSRLFCHRQSYTEKVRVDPTPPPFRHRPCPRRYCPACSPGVHDDPDEVRHSLLHNPRRERPHDETHLGYRPRDGAGSRVQTVLGRCAADSRGVGLLAFCYLGLLSPLLDAASSLNTRVALIENLFWRVFSPHVFWFWSPPGGLFGVCLRSSLIREVVFCMVLIFE